MIHGDTISILAETKPYLSLKPNNNIISSAYKSLLNNSEHLVIILILLSFITSIIFANSQALKIYFQFIQKVEICIGYGNNMVFLPLKSTINDLLLGIMFFLMGLEVKETYRNNTSQIKKEVSCAFFASFSGVFLSLFCFFMLNNGKYSPGISVAAIETDTAIILFVLKCFRYKLPSAIIGFVCLITIGEDILGIFLFNYFKASNINYGWMMVGILSAFSIYVMNYLNSKSKILFFSVLFVGWLCFELSGLHGTLITMCIGLLVPKLPIKSFSESGPALKKHLLSINSKKTNSIKKVCNEQIHSLIEDAQNINKELKPSILTIRPALESIVSFWILPVFIFMNGGIILNLETIENIFNMQVFSVILSLSVAKYLGIIIAVYWSNKLNFGKLPDGVSFNLFSRVALLFGVGFTFSLFAVDTFMGNSTDSNSLRLAVVIASLFSIIMSIFAIKTQMAQEHD